MTQLDGMVQRNAALVEESTAATSALLTQAMQLASAVSQFVAVLLPRWPKHLPRGKGAKLHGAIPMSALERAALYGMGAR